jgi:hypothetical protein
VGVVVKIYRAFRTEYFLCTAELWAWYYRYMSDVDKIIDKYALAFLDEFQEIFGYLPNDKELSLWKSGFMDGCNAIKETMENRIKVCVDCSDDNCKVCHP